MLTRRPATSGTARLVVDPIGCDGVGLCAHVAPDVVELDPWGYPVVPAGPVADQRQARRAVLACPKRALRLADG